MNGKWSLPISRFILQAHLYLANEVGLKAIFFFDGFFYASFL